MIEIDKKFIADLLAKAAENPHLCLNYDLRTSPDDSASVCSMLSCTAFLSRFIGIRTVPRISCCFREN